MSDEKKEVKQSSLLLDIIIIIIGALAVMLGVTSYVFSNAIISQPSWWPFTGQATADFVQTLGGTILLPLGVWVLIGGFGLVREKAWALGAIFVCFTLILYTAGVGLVEALWVAYQGHGLTAFAEVWANWVVIILVVVSFIGFIYLLATHKRYH